MEIWDNIVGVKLHAIIQLTRAYSTRKLEEFYRVTHKQICNWSDRFDSEGIDGLRMKRGYGRHLFLTHEHKIYCLKVLFLRKLFQGGTEHSFGIHVARMAGMPQEVVKRADEILKKLEKSEHENFRSCLN